MNKAICRLLAALVLLVSPTSGSYSQDSRVARIDSVFGEWVAGGDYNGSVLVAENGKIIYQKSFGKADWSGNRLFNNESVFELACVSKQFTAMVGRSLPTFIEPSRLMEMKPALVNREMAPLRQEEWLAEDTPVAGHREGVKVVA